MPKRQQGARVKDLFDLVIRDYRMNGKKSLPSVIFYLLHLEPFFGEQSAEKMGESLIEAYKDKRKLEGAKNATVNRELSVLRRGFKLGNIKTAPQIRMLSEKDNVRQGFCDLKEVSLISAALPMHYRRIALFGFYSGWRRGEILAIQRDWIDLDLQLIRMPGTHTKNGKARALALDGDLLDLVTDQFIEATDTPFLFSENGRQISKSSFGKAWKRACAFAGLPDLLFHDLRRSAVRNLLRAGVTQNVAMKQTGHLTDAILRRYDIVTEDDLRDAAKKVSIYLKKRNGGNGGKGQVPKTQGSPSDSQRLNSNNEPTSPEPLDNSPKHHANLLIYITNLLRMLLKMAKQRKERDARESSSPKLLE